jgi:hypothetical protein
MDKGHGDGCQRKRRCQVEQGKICEGRNGDGKGNITIVDRQVESKAALIVFRKVVEARPGFQGGIVIDCSFHGASMNRNYVFITWRNGSGTTCQFDGLGVSRLRNIPLSGEHQVFLRIYLNFLGDFLH